MRQLNVIKREGVTAKAELSRLMNLKPGTRYEVVPPTEAEMKIPNIPTKLTELTSYAMRSRPELFSEDYNVLISAEDTQIAFLRMFPGLELRGGVNFDSNSYLQDAMWTQTGLQVTWNLLNVFSGPEKMAVAETKEELAKLRRLALSIAVMTQVHVGHRQILQARQEYKIADELNAVEERIYKHAVAGAKASTQSELQLIRHDAEKVFAKARKNQAFTHLKDSENQLLLSLGVEPLPDLNASWKLPKMIAALNDAAFSQPRLSNMIKDGKSINGFGVVSSDTAISTWKTTKASALLPPEAPLKVEAEQESLPQTIDAPVKRQIVSEFHAHLGSYTTEAAAERGWSILTELFPELASSTKELAWVNLPSRGEFLRLYAVSDLSHLQTLCKTLSTQSTYCVIQPRNPHEGIQ